MTCAICTESLSPALSDQTLAHRDGYDERVELPGRSHDDLANNLRNLRAPLATRRPPRKEAPLKITSGGHLQGVPLRFGRSLQPSILASGPLGDATASFQGGSPIKTMGGGCLQVGPACLDHAPPRSLNRIALGLEITHPKLLASRVCQKDQRGRERGKVLGPGLAVIGARIRVILDSGLPQQRIWLDRPNVFQASSSPSSPQAYARQRRAFKRTLNPPTG
ncbi:hypothetical protein BC826DRAFT_1107740 [Russula brevipes]|nr:hypothetical protein BC826DRAFT_1107995 [Russula brevipes]KAI0288441.1 hypothetical protein BC826DRAFT_1107740 [Russula brevipes]